MKLDGRFMKLDAGSPGLFQGLNRPFTSVQWPEVMNGLTHLHRIVIQSMFVTGMVDNTSEAAISQWIKAVQGISPESVQVYTVDRPTAEEGIRPVPVKALQAIADRLSETSRIPSLVFE